ncbi:MAG: class IV adenylate cyclase [Candidatus Moraniibacteriota bacterium]
MKNIEIKVRVPNRSQTIKLVEDLHPQKKGVLRQVDTYFKVPNGRLKLREEKARKDADLIYYFRPDRRSSRLSEYDILKIDKSDVKCTKTFLEKALAIRVIVRKERILYLYRHTRIHLDQVMGLGDFLELETVITHQTITEAKQEHIAVCKALALDRLEKISGSYSDLLLKQK